MRVLSFSVMPRLVRGIHVVPHARSRALQDHVDGRDKPGHDGKETDAATVADAMTDRQAVLPLEASGGCGTMAATCGT